MSKTDKTRPWWVQVHDLAPAETEVVHSWDCDRAGACTLGATPGRGYGVCHPYPAGGFYGGHVPLWSRPKGRGANRRHWHRQDRAAQRKILRNLTREADSGAELSEDRIDNRHTHRNIVYGGGWWD
jgi:hypothetical protein